MPLALGLDLGTTTITALALDVVSGGIVARVTLPNDADVTTTEHKARGWSEWDVGRIGAAAMHALRLVTESIGPRVNEVAGLGLAGQQHGLVLVDDRLKPLGPLISWQDRRTEEINPHSGRTWLEEIRSRTGVELRTRTGCTLSPGYLGVTLYWLKENQRLPENATACFLVDYVASLLTGTRPVTDATNAASSGLFDVRNGTWDAPGIEALGLPPALFPELRTGGQRFGSLTQAAADETGLNVELPVCVGMGDNQASFYGSVADLHNTVLVNVGTGGQVATYCDGFVACQNLETRPFPGGYLLVNAGLCGGRTYAVLESFFRQVCNSFAGHPITMPLFDAMNRLAAAIEPCADGLSCVPLFTGTRCNPDLRGTLTGMSIENFTPGHLIRALLEGMAEVFHQGYAEIVDFVGSPRQQLIGAGNGIRQNPVLADLVAGRFGMPLSVPRHQEEAAFGAALLAAVGLGMLADHTAAARLIDYHSTRRPHV